MILGAITPAARLAAAMRGEVSEILCCPESALSPAARAAAYRLLRTAQNLEWWTRLSTPVSYTHLTLPTKLEV